MLWVQGPVGLSLQHSTNPQARQSQLMSSRISYCRGWMEEGQTRLPLDGMCPLLAKAGKAGDRLGRC